MPDPCGDELPHLIDIKIKNPSCRTDSNVNNVANFIYESLYVTDTDEPNVVGLQFHGEQSGAFCFCGTDYTSGRIYDYLDSDGYATAQLTRNGGSIISYKLKSVEGTIDYSANIGNGVENQLQLNGLTYFANTDPNADDVQITIKILN